MTDAELITAVREACAAATPGEWWARAGIQAEPWVGLVDVVDGDSLTVGRAMSPADACLIALARTALPELADRLEQALESRDGWKNAAESQNRQWSTACTERTEWRARAERAEGALDVAIRLGEAAETTGKALEARVRELEGALRRIILDPHQSYDWDLPAETHAARQYQIGVADGHRCAAEKARVALGGHLKPGEGEL